MWKTIDLCGFEDVVQALTVKTFVEGWSGHETVDALEVYGTENAYYVKVQFTSDEIARHIVTLCREKKLIYNGSTLTADHLNIDMMKPTSTTIVKWIGKLSFGCKISHDKFLELWTTTSVSVDFGSTIDTIFFYFTFNNSDQLHHYKIELRYQHIRKITLHPPTNGDAKCLLIELSCAPRIHQDKNPLFSFYKENRDKKWVRTIAPTGLYVGLSSGICLQLPVAVPVDDIDFSAIPHYEESHTPLVLENGSPYCPSEKGLVPIIQPTDESLPFGILFKICALVQTGCLPGPKVDQNLLKLVFPSNTNQVSIIERALEDMYLLKDCCYDPTTFIKNQCDKYRGMKGILPMSPHVGLDDGLVYVRRVQVTPSKVYFVGPEVIISNRVLRKYHNDLDNFLRVSFVDEERVKMYSADLHSSSKDGERSYTPLYNRILDTLYNGITIGAKKFEFLAYSSSQLRDSSVWMFASRDGLTAEDIRKWLGDFSKIKYVAKYAARLGQSFSSSTKTFTVDKDEMEIIPDITSPHEPNYVFSDGIGKISIKFAEKVARKCGLENCTPSAFQIRYAGYKGVVAVDPYSSAKLSLRNSMKKYESEITELDVLAWSKYQPCNLNRQIIVLLSSLGIPDETFLRKQRDVVARLDCMFIDASKAQDALELMPPGEITDIIKQMLKCGFKPFEPFISMVLQGFRSTKLHNLRTKAKIFIPEGRLMMGCLDETNTLNYGEIFVRYSSARSGFGDSSYNICGGRVVVAKNPCLHPGDIRVLKAVDVQKLYHMVDCVVFPQKGTRPHPNECSGSDLDGDMYFVCWDNDLIPTEDIPPMDYTSSSNTIESYDISIDQLYKNFADYIVEDNLGGIANTHMAMADVHPEGAMCKECQHLAKQFSIAVDFSKTGTKAVKVYPPKKYPDFMQKVGKPTYESEKVTGKLFRELNNIALKEQAEVASNYDPDMDVPGFETYIEEALIFKRNMIASWRILMDRYGIKTEAEIVGGENGQTVTLAMRSLRKEAISWFYKKANEPEDNPHAKASAWYRVTYDQVYLDSRNKDRDHFISFPWCVYDKLVEIKRNKSGCVADSLTLQ